MRGIDGPFGAGDRWQVDRTVNARYARPFGVGDSAAEKKTPARGRGWSESLIAAFNAAARQRFLCSGAGSLRRNRLQQRKFLPDK
jgi:hypothetical protein